MIARIKGSVVGKITLIFLVASIIPYLLASLFFFQSARGSLYGEVVKGLNRETALIRDIIDAKLFLMQGNAIAWSGLAVMNDILSDDVDKRIAVALEGLERDYDLQGEIHAVNKDGLVVASGNAAFTGKRVGQGWLDRVLKGEIVEFDVHPSEVDDHPCVSFAVPVMPDFAGGKAIGAILLEYHIRGLMNVMPTGDMPDIALINREGGLIAAFPDAGPLKDADFSLSPLTGEPINSPEGYIIALAKSEGYLNFNGFGWTIAAAVSEERALDPIQRVGQVSLAIALAGIILILSLVTIFARRLVRPLKDLSLAANRIARTKDFSSAVRYDASDEVGQLARAFNDMVEEVKRHMSQMEEMEEDLRRADRLSALGELSAGMAHEIKNPLGIIRSSADILKKRLDCSGQEGLLASAISEEAVRLSELLEAFLQFARPKPPEFNLCHLSEVVNKALILLESEISKSGITLVKELDSRLPAIYSDANQLHQVLVNIIINALQAMPEGGELKVLTRLAGKDDGIETEADKASAPHYIELTVSDTGRGISAEDAGKIFNPFFTTKAKGTGLGLSIVHRIITGLGGKLKLESVHPRGTAFRIFLPVKLEN